MLQIYQIYPINTLHDDVIKWKKFQHYWPFVRGIEFPAQRLVTRIFNVFLDRAWINGWVSNREAGDLRRHRNHYDVTIMELQKHCHGDQGQIGVIHLWYPLDAINIKLTWCIVHRDPASNIHRKKHVTKQVICVTSPYQLYSTCPFCCRYSVYLCGFMH